MLGEVFDPSQDPDTQYTGDGDSVLARVRQQIREFQGSLNALDVASREMRALMQINGVDEYTYGEAQAWLEDFEQTKGRLVMVADAVNTAAATANSLGLRAPMLSVPGTLRGMGFAPALIPVLTTLVGALKIAGIAWAVSYAISKIAEALQLADTARETIAAADGLPPELKAATLRQIAESQARIQQAQASGGIAGTVGNVAEIVKWVAIGAAAWFAYKALESRL